MYNLYDKKYVHAHEHAKTEIFDRCYYYYSYVLSVIGAHAKFFFFFLIWQPSSQIAKLTETDIMSHGMK